MTAPSGEPGLDPTPTAPPTPAPGAPAPAPQPTTAPGLDPTAPVDVASLPANVQKLIGDLRSEAAGHRQGATQAKQTLEGVFKALGLNTDGTAAKASPEQIAAQLTERAQAAEEARQAAEDALWGATVRSQIHQAAGRLGADPEALLDSSAFVDSLDDIADDDPSTPAFRTALEAAITAAVKANPRLAAQRGGTAAARMGADITGSGGGNTGRPSSLGAALQARIRG